MPKIVNEEPLLLTPEEVADLLRVTREEALGLLREGSLSGMSIAGQWRIRADSVKDFLSHGLQRENLRILERELNDPARWAKVLQEFPDLAAQVEQGDHEPTSFGAFLKNASQQTGAATEEIRAMGTIVLHHGSGAQDFEIVGPSWGPEEARRTVFNARRLLTTRAHTAAVALLDSAPFAVFPATNHFNDEFHVLHADLPLLEYESMRLSQAQKRHAATQLADAIFESKGPHIRFVAASLAIADPEDWDVFLCHASEDKESIARPLHGHLASRGINCWIDEAEIAWGESILAKIQEGLSRARYIIVILSPRLLEKQWPQKELRSALALEIESDRNIVLPLLVGDPKAVLSSLPFLREKRYLSWDGDPGVIERELRTLARSVPDRRRDAAPRNEQ